MRIAACGRRWGKTEALSLDIATLALDERDCQQLVVAPTDAQARLLGNEVLARLLDAWDWRDTHGKPHPKSRRAGDYHSAAAVADNHAHRSGGSPPLCRTPFTFGRPGGTGAGYGGCGRIA